MRLPRPELTIERARVRRAQPDSRAHLERALARLTPATVGVPQGALLIVRRLTLRTPLGAGRADAFVADLQERLRERLAGARRGGPDDLLFGDEADLAAAVIADWLDGMPPDRRDWQRIVTGGEPPPAWWRRTILPDARLLPRVVAALARAGRAAAWIGALDAAEVRAATHRLAAAHGIALAGPAERDAPGRPQDLPAIRATVAMLQNLLAGGRAEGLLPAARTLLTLCVALNRRPALTRERAFTAALATLATTGIARSDGHASAAAPFRSDPASPVRCSAEVRQNGDPAASPRYDSPPRTPFATSTIATRCTAVDTGFGGLFFLLNALLAMDLYGDFTRPLAVSDAPDPFDLLALLGRRWFGARFTGDPIAPLLAELAGRAPGEPIRFVPPAWHVPDAWLAPWPSAGSESWHPAGFPLAFESGDPRLPRSPAARWTAALALYLRARLARALDTDGPAAVRLTCRRPASMACDGDRVTVTFDLASRPLALRLAGLDRDPGYLPAARREIAFVFA